MNSLPGAALAVDQDRRVERRDPRRELEHVLHGGAARDEVLRRGVTGNALAQQVQFALTFGQVSFAALELLEPPVHDLPEVFDFLPKIGALKVEPKRLQLVTPAVSVLALSTEHLARLAPTHSVSRK